MLTLGQALSWAFYFLTLSFSLFPSPLNFV